MRPLISNHLRSHSDKNTSKPGTAPSLVSPLVTCILYPTLGHENNLTAQQPKQVSSKSSRKRTRRLGCTGCPTCIRVAGTHLPAESHIESHVIRLMTSSWASFEIDCYAVSRRWCDTWRLQRKGFLMTPHSFYAEIISQPQMPTIRHIHRHTGDRKKPKRPPGLPTHPILA